MIQAKPPAPLSLEAMALKLDRLGAECSVFRMKVKAFMGEEDKPWTVKLDFKLSETSHFTVYKSGPTLSLTFMEAFDEFIAGPIGDSQIRETAAPLDTGGDREAKSLPPSGPRLSTDSKEP